MLGQNVLLTSVLITNRKQLIKNFIIRCFPLLFPLSDLFIVRKKQHKRSR